MYTPDFYIQYFESIARRLNDLSHTDTTPRFWINMDSGNINELSNALNNQVRFPCLVLDEQLVESSGSLAQKMIIRGGFAILERYSSKEDKHFIREKRTRTMEIAQKILIKMKLDAHEIAGELSGNAITIGNIHQYPTPIILNIAAGWAVEFEWVVAEDLSFGMNDWAT